MENTRIHTTILITQCVRSLSKLEKFESIHLHDEYMEAYESLMYSYIGLVDLPATEEFSALIAAIEARVKQVMDAHLELCRDILIPQG